jgi:hypothetical protein
VTCWRHVDVERKRRHDVVRHLAELLKGLGAIDDVVLDEAAAAAARADSAKGPTDTGRKERDLDALLEGLGRMLDAAAPPATQDVQALRHDLDSVGRALASAEKIYRLAALRYNNALGRFPGSVVGGVAGFKIAELF